MRRLDVPWLAGLLALAATCTPLTPFRPDAGAGGGATGGGEAGGTAGGSSGGGVASDDADRVAVRPGSGLVGACVALELQPTDMLGRVATVAGGPATATVACVPPLGFQRGPRCDGGVATSVSLEGPQPSVVSTGALDLVRYDCSVSAPPLRMSAFRLEGHASLRVELTGGADTLTKNRCIELRVRATTVAGDSVFMPATSVVTVAVDGGAVGRSSLCDDGDAGATLTIQAGGSSALFYVRATNGSPDGGAEVVLRASPGPGVLADESVRVLSSACLPSGASCRATPGACCVSCNINTDNCF
ncbi:MAG: hypothetical protein JNJ54_04365 [Myxococcaceae bacterium]|nr:hypothetical protein [Myxococcaceae bacterium]